MERREVNSFFDELLPSLREDPIPSQSSKDEDSKDSHVESQEKNHLVELEKAKDLLKLNLTDTGNAETFCELYGKNFIYIKEGKKWVKYDGVRWAEANGAVRQKMVEAMRWKSQEAMKAFSPDSDEMKKIIRWNLKSESEYGLKAATHRAQDYLQKSHNEFDQNPWLLTCTNGVVDLKTGSLRSSIPEDMLQRSTNLLYDHEAKCPRWIQFLEEIFKANEELIDFIQRAIGYTLIGLTREQCLFILYGTGANGKSVFLGVLGNLLGEYGLTTPFSTFKDRNKDSIPNDIARMAGARLVKSAEIKEGARLNEERIKVLTGGDTMTARFLHNEWFDFDPIAKFWIAVNHKPTITGTEYAIWRRIREIDFEETFPPERRDKDLLEKLKAELPGILNWAIEGCLKYQEKGLEPVEKVRQATEQYRSESDVISQFLQEETVEDNTARIKSSDLYGAYKDWCKKNEKRVLSSTQFGKRIEEKRYRKELKTWVFYLGLRLNKPDAVR